MEVHKRTALSYDDFINDYYKPRIPVVLTDAAKDWTGRGIITPEYLKENFGSRTTNIGGQTYTIADLVDRVKVSTPENPAPYPAIFEIRTELPELLTSVSPKRLRYARPNFFENSIFMPGKLGNSVELFIGGEGCQFPFAHIDQYYTHAWITQVYGEKQIVVFPQGQDQFLYPKPDNPYASEVNIFNPDYTKHPEFKNATPIKVTVKEGETIFVPCGTWHTALSLTPNISIIFDQLNGLNYGRWKKDIWDFKKSESLPKAIATYGFALAAGTYCQLKETFSKTN